MASILFLDDCPTRRDWARRNLSHPDGIFSSATTAAETIDFLSRAEPEGFWATLYLDHDLDGEAWANPNGKNTGSEVVRWILLHKPKIGKVIVHSMNTPQGNRMARWLSRAGYNAEYRSWLTIVHENRDATPTTSSPATGPR